MLKIYGTLPGLALYQNIDNFIYGRLRNARADKWSA
jgi:hypothetical protein